MNDYYSDESQCDSCIKGAKDETLDEMLSNTGKIKADISVAIDNEGLSDLLNRAVENRLESIMIKKITQTVDNKVAELLRESWDNKISSFMREQVAKKVEERFEKEYPLATKEKVDEIYEQMQKYKFDASGGYSPSRAGVREQVDAKFKDYLDKEFKGIVEKTKKNIDEYAQNYFSRNLFKAMNLMSEMTEIEKVKKLTTTITNDLDQPLSMQKNLTNTPSS